jgi:hypothetical protein
MPIRTQGPAKKDKKPLGLRQAAFAVIDQRLLACGSRSGVSSGRSGSRSGVNNSGDVRSGRSRSGDRSRHNSDFFLLAASSQGNNSNQGSQQDRLFHTCPQESLNDDAITGNF